jgi:hypothetical protein
MGHELRAHFVFGQSRFTMHSDNAARRMKEALDELGVDDVWRRYRAGSAVSSALKYLSLRGAERVPR